MLKQISVYLTEEIVVSSGPSYRFRIEIFQSCFDKKFCVRLFRKEFFRVQPTFPQADGQPSLDLADEEFWVEDIGIVPGTYSAATEEDCLSFVKGKLSLMFS